MSRMTLWFSDDDTYEEVDTEEDTGSAVVALTDEGMELVSTGTTLKKFTPEERKQHVVGRLPISKLLSFFLEHHPGFFEPGRKPLYKTNITIWSDFDPQDLELDELARDAGSGESYCSKQKTQLVENPKEDPDWDGTEFFQDLILENGDEAEKDDA